METLLTQLTSASAAAANLHTHATTAALRRQALLGCQSLLDQIKVAQARLMADATTHRDWISTGHKNMADWLADTTKSSYGDAKRKEKLGNALGQSPDLSDAVASGQLSPDTAEALADIITNPPPAATPDDISDLVAATKGATPPQAKAAVDYWRDQLTSETEEEAETRRFAKRAVTTTIPADGTSTTSITLPVLHMRELLNAFDHAAGKFAEGDTRTNAQRLADGAITLAKLYNSGQVNGGRSNPNIIVTITAEAFAGLTNQPGHTPWGDRISAHTIRELAKNATLQRVVMAGDSIINLGRKVRYASHDQYLALIARDGSCRWGNCTTPAAWCDVDHVQQWANGGTTDVDWEWLLCPHHHTQRHLPGVTIHGNANSNTRITLADGTTIQCPPKGTTHHKSKHSKPPRTAPPGRQTTHVA